MILAQTNAKIVKVARGGTSEDYDVEDGADGTVWEGSADAYFGRRRATMTEGSVLNRTQLSYVIVPGDLVAFQSGDVVTLDQHGVVWTETVREFNDRDEMNLAPQPIRLDLKPR